MFIGRNDGFICEHCGATVAPTKGDTYRDHCPFCLYSKHIDIEPGDRACDCLGLMEPIAIELKGPTTVVVYRCTKCGTIKRNKAALKSAIQPDDYGAMLDLARKFAKGG